jgi:outer membrane immunogenic protein
LIFGGAALKKSVTATVLVALSVVTASAADVATRPIYTKAPIIAPMFNWTGFYAGVNIGVGVGRDLTNFQSLTGTQNPHAYVGPVGAIGGGQIGYNWQVGKWVFGLESDIQASDMQDNRYCGFGCNPATLGSSVTAQQKLDWFGTTRVRAGLATGPVFSYVTGGFAYGGVTTDFANPLLQGTVSAKQTRTGYTYGSGVEASLGGNWTGKLEYLYVDLGRQSAFVGPAGTTFNASSEIHEHIFRVGANYRIGGNAGGHAPMRVANWTGFYAGANAGSGLARNETSHTSGAPVNVNESYNLMPKGVLGGVQAGYNWQAANWVYGLEVDFQGSTQRDKENCFYTCTSSVPQFLRVDQTMPWLGTARVRVGYSVGETLFYGTGGFAYGEIKNKLNYLSTTSATAQTTTHTKGGWTGGGGIETPFDLFGLFGKNWTAKTEYLYVDLGRITDPSFVDTFAGDTHTVSSRVTEHIFRTGLNYHFN